MILFKKMLRTVWRYKAQFISMIIMIALGVGVYVGFDMEWYSLKTDGETFMEDTHYADYRVYNEAGFTARSAKKAAEIPGVDEVSRFLSVNAEVKGTSLRAAMTVTENEAVSGFLVSEGEPYDPEVRGIWLSDRFAEVNGFHVGDEMTLVYRSKEITAPVKALIKSSEHMVCVADSNQLMPDFSSFGYAYITPDMLEEALGTSYYPQLNILSDLGKGELEDQISDVLGYTALVVPKEDTTSYAALRGEIEEGKAMCAILPELFLLIALLTMITTMHRITANEKTQIGTLKALGFKDRKIARHYTSFAFSIGVFGSLLGVALGFFLARMIVNPVTMQGTYFDFWSWDLHMRPSVLLIIGAILVFLTLVGFLSVRSMLKGTAAEALRPYVPKKMKAILLERTRLWDHFRFGTKWNLRDVLRHKARSLMTLVGVVGCMLLLVAGFGMKDTLGGFLTDLTEVSIRYNTEIQLTEDAPMDAADRHEMLSGFSLGSDDEALSLQEMSEQSGLSLTGLLAQTIHSMFDQTAELYGTTSEDWDTALALQEKYEADAVANMSVKYAFEGEKIAADAEPTTLQIYDISHDTIRFFDEEGNIFSPGDDGVYICGRLADKGIEVGDVLTISPYGTSDTYTVKVAGVQQAMIMENMIMTKTCADNAGIDYHFSSLYTYADADEVEKSSIISGTQSRLAIVDSYDSFNQVMDAMIWVMVLAASILGVVVLYNLGVMSYIERYRELATLKVLGFRDRHIAKLLIGQNLWLTLLGILIGLPSGVLILRAVLTMLAAEYELRLRLGILTFLGSVVLTFAVSMVVSLFIARRNKKIDMVESLKGIE